MARKEGTHQSKEVKRDTLGKHESLSPLLAETDNLYKELGEEINNFTMGKGSRN